MAKKTRKLSIEERKNILRLIALLVFTGIILLALKNFYFYRETDTAAGDELWIFRIDASFDSSQGKDPVYIARPASTEHVRVIGENIQHPGLLLKRDKSPYSSRKELIFTPSNKGLFHLNITYRLHFNPAGFRKSARTLELTPDQRQYFLKDEPGLNMEQPEVSRILDKLKTDAADKNTLLKRIFDHVHNKINLHSKSKSTDASSALRYGRGNTLAQARAMISLCRKSQIPARLVTGFKLIEQKELKPHYWVDVFQEKQWKPYDPVEGYFGQLPKNHIPIRLEITEILRSKNPVIDLDIELSKSPDVTGLGTKTKEKFLDILDLTRLDLDTRNTLAILLLLPLGALITAFFRHIVGLRSYGIFTPPLLALAVMYSDPVTTSITFLIVIILGITGRSFLPGSMSRSPRLTIVYTLVAMSMVLSVSILDYYKINPGGHAILLPIVILASMIDRIYSTLDESGFNIAMRRLGWTVFIAIFCFFVLQMTWLGHWLTHYPEFHLFTLAATLWLPLYQGKTCAQLKYCSWMSEPAPEKNARQDDTSKKNESTEGAA